MTPPIAIDTSVAIPLLVATHAAHATVATWWAGRRLALAGHAFVETYAVLTRLPHDLRLAPDDAARLMSARFTDPLLLHEAAAREVPAVLSHLGISGGATYDALVALAAAEHGTNRYSCTRKSVSTSATPSARCPSGTRDGTP